MGIETLTNRDRQSGVIQQNPQHRHEPQQQQTIVHLTQRMDLAQHLSRYSTGSLPQNLGSSADRFHRQEGISLSLPQPWLNYSGGRSEVVEIDRFPTPDTKPRKSSSHILAKNAPEILTPDSGPFCIRRASLAAINEHSSPSSDVAPSATPLVIQNQVIQNQVTPNQVVMAADSQAPRSLIFRESSQFQDSAVASVAFKKGDLEASSMPLIQRSSQNPPTSSSGETPSLKAPSIGILRASSIPISTDQPLYRLSELVLPHPNPPTDRLQSPPLLHPNSTNPNPGGIIHRSSELIIQAKKNGLPDESNQRPPESTAMPLFTSGSIALAQHHRIVQRHTTNQNQPSALAGSLGSIRPETGETIMRVGNGVEAGSSVIDSAIGPSGTPSLHRPTPKIDSAILVEQVSRILGRQLAVERERRGLKP